MANEHIETIREHDEIRELSKREMRELTGGGSLARPVHQNGSSLTAGAAETSTAAQVFLMIGDWS
jgi:hypothetical protein